MRVGRADVERPEVLGPMVDVSQLDGQHQSVLPVADETVRRLAVGGLVVVGGLETVGGQVVAGEASGWRARVILDHAELVESAADAVANPRRLQPRVPGAADRAAIAGPSVPPTGHQFDRATLHELFRTEVEDCQLVVVRSGTTAIT